MTVYHSEDYLDYCSIDGLTKASGVESTYHIKLAVKELVDNTLDVYSTPPRTLNPTLSERTFFKPFKLHLQLTYLTVKFRFKLFLRFILFNPLV